MFRLRFQGWLLLLRPCPRTCVFRRYLRALLFSSRSPGFRPIKTDFLFLSPPSSQSLAPRAIVLIIVVTLYAHLFIFLRRPDRISTPNSSELDEVRIRSTNDANELNFKWWTRKRALGVGIPGEDVPSALHRPTGTFARANSSDKIPMQDRAGGGGSGLNEKYAPWERLDLEIPNLDGQSDSSPFPTGRRVSIAPLSNESPRGGSRRGSLAASPLHLPVPVVYTTAPSTPTSPNLNYTPSEYFPSPTRATTLTSINPPLSPSSLAPSSQTSSSRTPLTQSSTPQPRAESESTTLSGGDREEDLDDDDSTESEVDSLSPPSRTKAGGRGRNGLSLKDVLDSTGPTTPSGAALGSGGNRVMDSGGGSAWGSRMEAEGRGGGSWSGNGAGENQESMNAYMNRKASMLMILFPLAVSTLNSTNQRAKQRRVLI